MIAQRNLTHYRLRLKRWGGGAWSLYLGPLYLAKRGKTGVFIK